ncbi:glycosyltransferase [Microbacterium sp. BWR-S6Y]|jgi:putative flippase GtrA|uniref:glycosyltransferase n=2 Tax=Microbacterium TaxID=33882 RepID=UPI001DEE3683|nr:glycosyltransferase [Microbacterium sp. Bi128]CAH0219590.1 Undecaprenyl-phosphate mannosyltransferase [Microbacterium sp. Bi128]
MDVDSRLMLEVVVPVHNEQDTLDASIRTLHRFLSSTYSEPWMITIADNASVDSTPVISAMLQSTLPGVQYLRLEKKGRGHALKIAWLLSQAEVLAYVDADLSTDLRALPPLIAPLTSGHSDVAIGTRHARSSRVVRGPKREFISRGYNMLLRRTMGVEFTDAQCGFKAIRRDIARTVLPHVVDSGWFFDSELLVIAERAGLRIHEVPVDWVDDTHSSVNLILTAVEDMRGMVRVSRDIATGRIPVTAIYTELGRKPLLPAEIPSFAGQVMRFLLVGGFSTLAYALLYLILAAGLAPQLSNFLALLVTAVANTAANRRFTFAVRGGLGRTRHHLQGLVVFGLAWALTSGALLVLHSSAADASATVELVVLTAANLAATAMRFTLLRLWVFARPADRTTAGDNQPATTTAASCGP